MGNNEQIDLEKLLKNRFDEYPPHDFPLGVIKVRTGYRHVYYKFDNNKLGMDWTTWVVFNNKNEISDLNIYNIENNNLIKIVNENGKTKDGGGGDNYFLIFERLSPSLSKEAAYKSLKEYTNEPKK